MAPTTVDEIVCDKGRQKTNQQTEFRGLIDRNDRRDDKMATYFVEGGNCNCLSSTTLFPSLSGESAPLTVSSDTIFNCAYRNSLEHYLFFNLFTHQNPQKLCCDLNSSDIIEFFLNHPIFVYGSV
ncbi:hypothetical protein DICVIV_01783 [Dictyocaulus viviparus]|uniref:Uncharacterized protein n=1 Tax=Dictyocaulus viviparus TaxID=29172 RepID=A0A0D8YBX8_DICVI|nr:hypothetical protein DICVIV_01783 [Dictyocaulus viviparus]